MSGYGSDAQDENPGFLVAHFKDQKIHPVFLFGAPGAGKTVFLCSLLYNGMHGNLEKITLLRDPDKTVFPDQSEHFITRNAEANKFWGLVNDFGNGSVPSSTTYDKPIFIRTELTSTPGQGIAAPPVSIVLYDLKGEKNIWDTSNNRFHDASEEIRKLFIRLDTPISLIFVVPSFTGDHPLYNDEESKQRRMREACDSAISSISLYKKLRPRERQQGDNFLMLLTKWDNEWQDNSRPGDDSSDARMAAPYTPSVETLTGFVERIDDIAAVLREFRNLPERAPLRLNRRLMAFSSGIIRKKPQPAQSSGEQLEEPANARNLGTVATMPVELSVIRPRPKEHATILDMNRRLWAWLYGNATESIHGKRANLDGTVIEETTIPDVTGSFVYRIFGFSDASSASQVKKPNK